MLAQSPRNPFLWPQPGNVAPGFGLAGAKVASLTIAVAAADETFVLIKPALDTLGKKGSTSVPKPGRVPS